MPVGPRLPMTALTSMEAILDFKQHRERKISTIRQVLEGSLDYRGSQEIWQSVENGEVQHLIFVLEQGHADEAAILRLGVPRFVKIPDKLKRWVRWGCDTSAGGDVGACLRCSLADRLRQLARRIIAARAVEDGPLLRELQGIGRRYAAAIQRGASAAPLAVLESFPALATVRAGEVVRPPLVKINGNGFCDPVSPREKPIWWRSGDPSGFTGHTEDGCEKAEPYGVHCVFVRTASLEAIPKCSRALFSDPADKDCGDTCPCWRVVKHSTSRSHANEGNGYVDFVHKGKAAGDKQPMFTCMVSPQGSVKVE